MFTFSWGSSDVTTSINTFNIFQTEDVNMLTAQIQTTGWSGAATVYPNPNHKTYSCPPMSVLCPAWGGLISSETILQTNTLFCSTPINLFIWPRSRLKWRSVQRLLAPFTSILYVGETCRLTVTLSHSVQANQLSAQVGHLWGESGITLTHTHTHTHTKDSCQIPF